MLGHSRAELQGLCSHPLDDDIFATSGDDMTVRMWSISKNRVSSSHMYVFSTNHISWILCP